MLGVTVSQKGEERLTPQAQAVAKQLGLPFVPRRGRSMTALKAVTGIPTFLMMAKEGPKFVSEENKAHTFHLSMAQLRLLRVQRGGGDPLLKAIGLAQLDSFLDCTAGLGSDSLLVAYGYPQCRKLLALEGNIGLAYITNYGMRHFCHEEEAVTKALRRIQVMAVRYESFLKAAPTASFDVVYFDPMFAVPVAESPQFLGLREDVLETPLTSEMLLEAARVAKYKVIVKERSFSPLWKNPFFHEQAGGKYSRVAYGIHHCR